MRFQILIFLCLGLSSGILAKNAKIVGGMNAYISDYPYVTSLRNVTSNHLYCAGSIISHWHVLTSGHCLLPFSSDYSNLRIYSGTNNIKKTDGPTYFIDKVFFHSEFRHAVSVLQFHRFDVAVIKVTSYIEFNEFQKRIELPTANIFTGNYAVVLGWGKTAFPHGPTTDTLKKAPMQLYTPDDCVGKIPTVVHSDQFCAFFSRGTGTCLGDSGGPVIKDDKIVGIISLSYGCAMGFADVHSNVFLFVDFIKAAMRY